MRREKYKAPTNARHQNVIDACSHFTHKKNRSFIRSGLCVTDDNNDQMNKSEALRATWREVAR